MKFYLDENISPVVASELRKKGIDVVSAYEIKSCGLSDRKQFELAIIEKRILITYDVRDFIELGKEYLTKGKEHSGLILVSNKTIPHRNIGKLISAIKKIVFETHKEKDFLKNKMIFLTK